MGCNCTKSPSRGGQTEVPAMNLKKIKDSFVRFEKSFPFYRMHIHNFRSQIINLGKNKVSIEELSNRFEGAMWRDHLKEGSELEGLLKTLPGCKDGLIDVQSILILGLLWCGGDNEEKALALFELVNPVGQNQESISAGDKEWE